MADTDSPTRPEVDAKLQAVEARLDSKLATIDGKLDRLFDRIELAIEASKEAKGAAEEARKSASNMKWNILFTGIGVAAVLIAAWAVWVQGMELIAGIIGATATK